MLRMYEMRQCWRHFENNALEFWKSARFRIEYRLHRAWPFRLGAWLHSMSVPKGLGFGKFREKEEMMHLSFEHPGFDNKHKGLFNKEAAVQAFKHVSVDDGIARRRRPIAKAFLIIVQRDDSSWRSRTDCAFEAVYLYALAALLEQAEKYAHPDAVALKQAAEVRGLTAQQITPAIHYLARRYAPLPVAIDRTAYDLLISIAKRLGCRNDNTV